jgi:exopolysaccharide production protein ExoZ
LQDKGRSPPRQALLGNIQYLRAAAAYLVVLYHARVLTPSAAMPFFESGRAGVDIFFVISGFIIQHVAARDDSGRPGAFLLKRTIRIVPLYWPLTLAIAAVLQVAPGLAGSGGLPDPGRMIRSLLFVPYFDDAGEVHPVLFIGWTLNYEMFFYAVFAAGLLIVRPALRLAVVSGALLLLVVAGVAAAPRDAIGLTLTSPLLLEFGAGLWLGYLWGRWQMLADRRSLRATARIAMLAAIVAIPLGEMLWPDVPQVLRWGVPAVAIVAGALALERSGPPAGRRGALLLGEASYAIYLCHPFVIKIVALLYARLHVASWPLDVLALGVTLAIVGIAGVAMHLLVERPLVRTLRHRLLPRARPAVAAGEVGGDDPAPRGG